MAITKSNVSLESILFSFDSTTGAMTDVVGRVTVSIVENGVPTVFTYTNNVSLLSQLTPAQVTMLSSIAVRLRMAALASDIPFPTSAAIPRNVTPPV